MENLKNLVTRDWQSSLDWHWQDCSSIWTIFVLSLPTQFMGNGCRVYKTMTCDWRFFSWSHPLQILFHSLIRQCLQINHYYNTIIALSLSLSKWSNFILLFLPSLWLQAQHWLPPATMSGKSIITVTDTAVHWPLVPKTQWTRGKADSMWPCMRRTYPLSWDRRRGRPIRSWGRFWRSRSTRAPSY